MKCRRSSGAIVNFGSIWGDLGSAGVAAYCASKGAVHNLTRALGQDHAADGIRVNAVCPGEVNTPMLQSERAEPVTQQLLDADRCDRADGPVGRPGRDRQASSCFLASDDASYMTGAMVSVDAGYGATMSLEYRRLGRTGVRVAPSRSARTTS